MKVIESVGQSFLQSKQSFRFLMLSVQHLSVCVSERCTDKLCHSSRWNNFKPNIGLSVLIYVCVPIIHASLGRQARMMIVRSKIIFIFNDFLMTFFINSLKLSF